MESDDIIVEQTSVLDIDESDLGDGSEPSVVVKMKKDGSKRALCKFCNNTLAASGKSYHVDRVANAVKYIRYSSQRINKFKRCMEEANLESNSSTFKSPLDFYFSVRIILDHAGIVQAAKLLKQTNIQDGGEECVMSTQEYIKKVVEDVGEDEDFKRGSWVSAIEYVNVNGGIVSGCLEDIRTFSRMENLTKFLQ
nr:hypothetical protein [Tanacetum cinerariifolium]